MVSMMGIWKKPPVKIGLALGGGGARGLAHVGVLKVLDRERIPIHCIAGTSAGSIIGAMYAQLQSAADMEDRIRNYFSSERFRDIGRSLASQQRKDKSKNSLIDRMFDFIMQQYIATKAFNDLGLLDRKVLDAAVGALLEEEDIRDMKIKCAVVATDLWKGEEVVLTRGSVRKAVSASASIPGTFPPMVLDGRFLVDGCVIDMVPVREAWGIGADRVIAVDVTRELVRPPAFKNGLEILFRADEITNFHLNEIHLKNADVVVRPKMGNAHWAEFDRMAEFVRHGEAAAEEKLDDILKLVRAPKRRWFSFFKGIWKQ
jgi:NTE family protein